MSKTCDNKSVGVIIRNGEKYAVIFRKNYPVSHAFVAGHCDGDSFEDAAVKEAEEEASISVKKLEKRLDETYQNPCKNTGGSFHEWTVFEATAWEGELNAGSDAKKASWMTRGELQALADKTLAIAERKNIPLEEFPAKTPLFVDDEKWEKDPGLEPVWVVMLKKIGII